jgi:hypothetical protein
MPIDENWKPHLFPGEEKLFDTEFRRARALLEYGMGGSTIAAFEAGVPRIVSVDSDLAWVEKVRQRIGGNAAHVELLHCDIGRTTEWGMPIDRERMYNWPAYFVRPWEAYAAADAIPDLVYIDGRFRVACALYSILMLGSQSWLRRRTRLMLHDFSPDRPHYKVITEFASIIAHANTLVVLRPQRHSSLRRLVTELLARQFDPR